MRIAVVLVVLAAVLRIVAAHVPVLSNFSPLMAVAFCSAVYFRNRWLWLAPFAALSLTDLYLDHYYATAYGYSWTITGPLLRMLCFAAGLMLGHAVSTRRSWLNLLSGTLGASVLFYLVTNTASWLGDMGYAHNAAGWWQAMTVGHPEFPPTLFFFRNTLVSDLLFTGVFALGMELAAQRRGEESLIKAKTV